MWLLLSTHLILAAKYTMYTPRQPDPGSHVYDVVVSDEEWVPGDDDCESSDGANEDGACGWGRLDSTDASSQC